MIPSPYWTGNAILFARKEIRSFEDLAGKRVVVGTKESGNWVTANNLLRLVKEQIRHSPAKPPMNSQR